MIFRRESRSQVCDDAGHQSFSVRGLLPLQATSNQHSFDVKPTLAKVVLLLRELHLFHFLTDGNNTIYMRCSFCGIYWSFNPTFWRQDLSLLVDTIAWNRSWNGWGGWQINQDVCFQFVQGLFLEIIELADWMWHHMEYLHQAFRGAGSPRRERMEENITWFVLV